MYIQMGMVLDVWNDQQYLIFVVQSLILLFLYKIKKNSDIDFTQGIQAEESFRNIRALHFV